MAKDFYPEIVRRLKDAGCQFRRQGKDSHEIWFSPLSGRTFTVPRTKRRATANSVMKDAGLPKSF
ncbi:MAG: type II toxin-antitoxin system HicA family toxin [Caulobacteraceae bacterium]